QSCKPVPGRAAVDHEGDRRGGVVPQRPIKPGSEVVRGCGAQQRWTAPAGAVEGGDLPLNRCLGLPVIWPFDVPEVVKVALLQVRQKQHEPAGIARARRADVVQFHRRELSVWIVGVVGGMSESLWVAGALYGGLGI